MITKKKINHIVKSNSNVDKLSIREDIRKSSEIPTINVVAALIYKDGKVLIARRATGDENVLGKWEFPGGKVKNGESEKHAIEREIKEELNLKIKAIDFVTNNVFKYPTKVINLKLYRCSYIYGEIDLNDHSEYIWEDRKKLLDYDLADADIPLAKYVKENVL